MCASRRTWWRSQCERRANRRRRGPPPVPPDDVYSAEWSRSGHVRRTTVDLEGYPDLVVMHLAMRLNSPRGVPTLVRFLRQMRQASAAKPDGLLHHEVMLLPPLQFGMRHYWRDFDSLERWARSPPHRDWWRAYLQGTKGTGFWHETYFKRGGFEAIYDNVRSPVGLLAFAPLEPPVGGMFTARMRLKLGDARPPGPEGPPGPP